VAPGDAAEQTLRRVRRDLVPQVIANAFSVLSLAMVSSVIVLVLAYLNVYGLSPWGLSDYTRTVGRVFDPVVTLGFVLQDRAVRAGRGGDPERGDPGHAAPPAPPPLERAAGRAAPAVRAAADRGQFAGRQIHLK
jgi:hypothetical protein